MPAGDADQSALSAGLSSYHWLWSQVPLPSEIPALLKCRSQWCHRERFHAPKRPAPTVPPLPLDAKLVQLVTDLQTRRRGGSATPPSECPEHSSVAECCRMDGFGAKYTNLMEVYAFSVIANLTFCVMPWHKMEHKEDARAMFWFIGGPRMGPPARNHTFLMAGYKDRGFPGKSHGYQTAALAFRLLPQLRPQLRAFYDSTPKPRLRHFVSGAINLALHVRRGDVGPRSHPNRWLPPEEIASCVRNVMRILNSSAALARGRQRRFNAAAVAGDAKTQTPTLNRTRPVVLHVFSENQEKGLEYLAEFNPRFHLNLPLRKTFHSFVEADALILAKSDLTGAAAVLRTGHTFSSFGLDNQYNGYRNDIQSCCDVGKADSKGACTRWPIARPEI